MTIEEIGNALDVKIDRELGGDPEILAHIADCAGHRFLQIGVGIDALYREMPISRAHHASSVVVQIEVWRADETGPRGVEQKFNGRTRSRYCTYFMIDLGTPYHGPVDIRAWKVNHEGGEHIAKVKLLGAILTNKDERTFAAQVDLMGEKGQAE